MKRAFSVKDWEQYAEYYDALNELRPYREMVDDVLGVLPSLISSVLDAGCGTGNISAGLSLRAGRVIGVDRSSLMIKRARRKCAGGAFVVTDLDTALPFRDQTFNAIVCMNTLYALKNTAMVLLEFLRVLHPGGKLIIVTPKYGYENGLILKAHCKSKKPDSYWLNAHATAARETTLLREALSDKALEDRFRMVAQTNRKIAFACAFTFFKEEQLASLTKESGFAIKKIGYTYANQNLLLVAEK
jgi:SAM-dependent methyltransferase